MSDDVIAVYIQRDAENGELWLDVIADGQLFDSVGPFGSQAERKACLEDLMEMMRSTGAFDMPPWPQ